jgi:hypothetical protein
LKQGILDINFWLIVHRASSKLRAHQQQRQRSLRTLLNVLSNYILASSYTLMKWPRSLGH